MMNVAEINLLSKSTALMWVWRIDMSAPKIVRNSRGPEEKTVNQYCYTSNSLLLEIISNFWFSKRKIEQWQFQTLSITFADTPLNHPARQRGWGSNVGWSSMDASVGGGKENSKRDWGINGKRRYNYGGNASFEHKNGHSTVVVGGHFQKEWSKHASCCFCCCCCCCCCWLRTVPPFRRTSLSDSKKFNETGKWS